MVQSTFAQGTQSALRILIGGMICSFLVLGCVAEVRTIRPAGYTTSEGDVVYVANAPVNIEAYPREAYGGATVYLVEGRWYRRSSGHWQSYRTEPAELGKRRALIEHGSYAQGAAVPRRSALPRRAATPSKGRSILEHRR